MRQTLIFTSFFILCASSLVLSQTTLSGTVVDQMGNPISKATVTLEGTSAVCTTGTNGVFSFNMAQITPTITPPPQAISAIEVKNNVVIIRNLQPQKVTVTLHDLRGRTIFKLLDDAVISGRHSISLPPQAKNKTALLTAKIGNRRETYKFIGNTTSGGSTNFSRIEPLAKATEPVLTYRLLVKHTLYDEKNVSIINTDEPLVIRLFRKIVINSEMQLKIGDTLSSQKGSLTLSLDSIRDERCGCDVLCTWQGNAVLHFTLNVNGTNYPISLQTYDKNEETVGDFTITLRKITPCPQDDPGKYSVTVAVTSSDVKPVLFLEHFTFQTGTQIAGFCAPICIDFPTYSFNQETRYLTSWTSFKLNDSALIVYGSGLGLDGTAGCGAASGLTFVTTLPYSDRSISINSLDENGTVHLSFGDSPITLAPGQSWVKDTTYIQTWPECESEITQSDRISNFGFLMPYQIRGSEVSFVD